MLQLLQLPLDTLNAAQLLAALRAITSS